MPEQKRPSAEYISKLTELYEVWSRKNSHVNTFVFKDLDMLFEKAIKDAYQEKCFEAYAHLRDLKDFIDVTFPNKLLRELEFIKKLPA